MSRQKPALSPQALQEARQRLGLTQEELAERLGVHRTTVARWELGKRAISRMAANLIARLRKQEEARTAAR